MSLLKKRMIRTYLSILLTCMLCAASCEEDDQTTSYEQDVEKLELQLEEIRGFAQSLPCERAEHWSYAPYGAKPCGGPWGYIAYSNDIDTDQLFSMIDAYDEANRGFNEKWGLGSDCALEPVPAGVTCEGGKPVLLY
jgi:hypothetical protein